MVAALPGIISALGTSTTVHPQDSLASRILITSSPVLENVNQTSFCSLDFISPSSGSVDAHSKVGVPAETAATAIPVINNIVIFLMINFLEPNERQNRNHDC